MKKLIVFFSLFAGIASAQQFPVSAFKMYSSVDPGVPAHETQLQKTLPLMQGASFNYGMPFSHNLTDTQINQLLDSAAVHNIKIILPGLMEKYSGVQRFYLDANDDYFAYRRGDFDANNNDAEAPSPMYQKTSLKATVPNDYMVKDVRYSPVYPGYPGGLNYKAVFRLKVARTGSPAPTTPVVDIEVWDSTLHSSYSKTTLVSSDFPSDNTYYTFNIIFNSRQICYTSSTPPPADQEEVLPFDRVLSSTSSTVCYNHDFDFRVKWYAQIDVWLDNIRVDGEYWWQGQISDVDKPDQLFSGQFNTEMKTRAKDFNADQALARFYLKDEPYITQYLACKYTNDRLREAAAENGLDPSTGKGLGHAAKTEGDYLYGTQDPYVRYAQEAVPYELATDIYRLRYNDPGPLSGDPNYTTVVQDAFSSAIDKFKLAQQNSVYAESRTWWYYPNIGLWAPNDNELFSREPNLAEIKAQVHLALAYGAKGVMYFHYWTYSYNPSTKRGIIGLIDPATLDPINSTSQYSVYGENKWDGIKALNQKLTGSFGLTLMTLTWQNGFSIHQQPSLAGTYVTSVITSDAANERYVELALFKDGSNNDYFMLVNRRTKSDETRNITVNFSLPSGSWRILDVSSGNGWIILNNGSMVAQLTPGEGRLYKITSAANLSSMTIPGGAVLNVAPGTNSTFASGASLVINGTLNATGTSTSRITFDRSGTSGTWGGIIFNAGWNSTIKYAHISHAEKGITYQCGGPNFIEYTEIDFCNYGIYQPQCSGSDYKNFYNNSVHNNIYGFWFDNIWYPYLDGNHIYNNSYGIYSFGGDAEPEVWRNTIENNSSAGLFVYDGGWAYLAPNAQNVFSDNWVGVDCRQYAGASLGTSSSPGYNKFSNNYDYDVWASSSCPDIYAIMNCWLTGVNVWHEGSGQIYTTPTWNCSGLGKAAVAVRPINGTGGVEITGSTTNDDPVAVEHDRRGQALMAEEKFQEALEEFQFVLDNYATAEVAKSSLHSLYRCYRKSGKRQGGLAYIGLIARKHEAIELGGQAGKLIVYQLVRQGRCQEALGMMEKIRARFPDTELEEVLLFREGVIYRYAMNDISKANEVFGELVGRYPDGRLADVARLELGISPKGLRKEAEPKAQPTSEAALPQTFSLEQNYPNPFNPTTEIRYQIPEVSHVSLKVYDVLGREVRTLVQEFKRPGVYDVEFDASGLPSGVYFYRLQANNIIQMKAMVLLR